MPTHVHVNVRYGQEALYVDNVCDAIPTHGTDISRDTAVAPLRSLSEARRGKFLVPVLNTVGILLVSLVVAAPARAFWAADQVQVDPDGPAQISPSATNGGVSNGGWLTEPQSHESAANSSSNYPNSGIQGSGYSIRHEFTQHFYWADPTVGPSQGIKVSYHSEIMGATQSPSGGGGGCSSNIEISYGTSLIGASVGGNSSLFSYQDGDDSYLELHPGGSTDYDFQWVTYTSAAGYRSSPSSGSYTSWAKVGFYVYDPQEY